mmetsp:Transcript_8540/g.24509  ORF Transcript_8540/g.24509 Transcript_8540/m.24509 type:complete len:207 (+) Transcript_8540:1278-1898(+)
MLLQPRNLKLVIDGSSPTDTAPMSSKLTLSVISRLTSEGTLRCQPEGIPSYRTRHSSLRVLSPSPCSQLWHTSLHAFRVASRPCLPVPPAEAAWMMGSHIGEGSPCSMVLERYMTATVQWRCSCSFGCALSTAGGRGSAGSGRPDQTGCGVVPPADSGDLPDNLRHASRQAFVITQIVALFIESACVRLSGIDCHPAGRVFYLPDA